MIKDMTVGNPTRLILGFTLPLLVGNIFQQLYNMADTIIVGRTLGYKALAAVGGSSGSIMFLVFGFFFGLTSGLAVITAQRFGAHDEEGVRKSVATSTIICTVITVFVTLFCVLGVRTILRIMDTPEEIFEDTCNYLIVIFYGAWTLVFYGMLSSIIRALGDSRTPLYFLIVSSLVNVVLDLYFILNLKSGVAGAAWATVIAFVVSCAMASFWYLRSREMYITIRRSDYRPDARVCRGILSVGGPEALELSIMYLFNIFLNYMVIECGGTDMVGLYSTGWRVANFILIIAQSMGGAMVAVCAAEYGMRRFDMIWDAFRFSVGRSVVWTIVLSVVLALGSGLLASVFTVSDDLAYLHDETARMFLFFALFLPVMSLVYTGSSLMQSIDKASGAMVNSLARNVIMSLAFLAATVTFGTLTSLWWAMALSEILGGVMMGAHAWLVLRRTEAREGGAPSP